MNVIVANKYKEMLMGINIEVIKSIEGIFSVDEILETFTNFYFERMLLDITAIENYQDINNIQKLSVGLDMSKVILILDDRDESETSSYLSKLISMGIYNFTRNVDGINYLLGHPNIYRDVAHIHQLQELTTEVEDRIEQGDTKIIGIKNITDHAGATTLIYMLKKQLEVNYKVIAFEVNKNDFSYFNDELMKSVLEADLAKELMKSRDYDVVLIDLNSFSDEGVCDDILYLIEPSTIKLNKMMLRDKKVFDKLKNKKIILNKSLLDNKDLTDFEFESNSNVFYNMPPMDDKNPNINILNKFLCKIGFVRQYVKENNDEKNSILGLFKK